RKPDGSYESMRVMLMKSTNGGDTWNYLSTIRENAGEATIARGKNGSILAVMRVENTSMVYKISSAASNGTSWSASATVPDIPANKGVDPYLQWMPNGILALSYGDNVTGNMRNCHVAYSIDDGANWVGHSVTYQSTPGTGFQNKSSGYTSAFPLRNNRFMQLSDRALYTYYDSGDPTPVPNPFSIWSSTFDVVTNYRNRIDLKKRVSPGQVEFITDMTYTNGTHPEAGVHGAYDASTDYWSGAFKQASSGYYTIDLKRNQTINAIAVSLLHGRAQGATIEHSQDGINWTLLKSYPGTTVHYTVDYTSFSSIVARYVRVNVTSSMGWVGLNEISLFSPEDTFEDYALNVKPYSYTMLNTGFWVSEGVTPLPTGYQSQRALYMYDADATNKELSRTGYTASDAQVMEFKLKIKGFASSGCVQFCLKSGTTSVFRIAVFPVTGTNNGTIKYNNGTWNALLSGTNVLIPKDAWRSVKVVADAPGNVAAIYIDGTFAGYATKQTAGATTMDGIMFASGGSGAIGDEALFDDVVLYPYGTIPGSAQAASSSIPVKSNLADKNLDQLNSFGIRLSPNPAGSTMGLTVSNAEQGKLYVQVVNISGTVVKKVEFTVTGSTDKYEMPIADLAQGMYIVQVTQGKNTLRAKLIKQ
ncbi:MAG TPA: discoidin domain-containing protein, partial [Pedobacter sp.]|uniref:discoidin domain-containing protein n=1 Tax=Pedobacter sp. TaxID=1411316 RepID=UPI002C04B62C